MPNPSECKYDLHSNGKFGVLNERTEFGDRLLAVRTDHPDGPSRCRSELGLIQCRNQGRNAVLCFGSNAAEALGDIGEAAAPAVPELLKALTEGEDLAYEAIWAG